VNATRQSHLGHILARESRATGISRFSRISPACLFFGFRRECNFVR